MVERSIFVRRDLAMLAGMCAAPEQGCPRDLALIRMGGRKRGPPLQNCGFGVDLLRYRSILLQERTHFSGKRTNPWRSDFCTG